MAELFMMMNPTICPDGAQRRWLEVGDALRLSNVHLLELGRERFDDFPDNENQLVVTERIRGDVVHRHYIQGDHWLMLPTRRGYLELIPKAIAFDRTGHISKLMCDLLETPAIAMSTHQYY